MFYNAFGICEYFEDINILKEKENDKDKIKNPNQTGFVQTNTVTPQNIMQFKKNLNVEIFNTALINLENINKFNYNTVGITMDTIFDFESSIIGTNKPFITNIVNFNKNKIYFKYKDQYKYDINLISDELINNGLYNIIYLPIQALMSISKIDATDMNIYNSMNGTIITVDNNIELTLPYNKIFEIYIFPMKQIKLICNHFEGKVNIFTLEPNVYYYIYYNITNPEPISITTLYIVNLNFITIPTNINLTDNSNLIYYNNFLNYNNNKFYNTINKKYDTLIMNCTNCNDNIAQYGSRYSSLAYKGINNSYIKLPELNLSKSIITFSINFKTDTTNNDKQVLFDIGNISNDNKNITSLFINFENNTIRFNYVKNNELKSTFLYNEGNPIINDNQWHNIIWTLTFDNWIIYVDTIKILNAKKVTPNRYDFNCKTNLIGKKISVNILYFNYLNFIGLIDNFKIFNKELSFFEIKNENIK